MEFFCLGPIYKLFKVRKTAKIRKRYNQVPHLTQDTTWSSNKKTINITNKSLEDSPFPANDHKAAMSKPESMRNTRHKKPTNDPQEKYSLGTVSKNILLEDLNYKSYVNYALKLILRIIGPHQIFQRAHNNFKRPTKNCKHASICQ